MASTPASIIPRHPPQPLFYHEENMIKVKPDHTINFRHPGYSDVDEQNVLLSLFAFDHPDGGLHFSTAHLACAIVAGNAWDGYLTETRGGPPLHRDWDDILMGKEYYFYVPWTDAEVADDGAEARTEGPFSSSSVLRKDQYPVYPSFDHWRFPHRNMPEYWPTPPSDTSVITGRAPPSASGLTNYVIERDRCCLITSSKDGLERAHLCPRQKDSWFRRNQLDKYNLKRNLGAHVLDDVSNSLALRSDLHSTFDDRKFLIAYKKSNWLVHFLEVTNELGELYHNVMLNLDASISPRLILVRFAWAIFPFARGFLERGFRRRLRLRVENPVESPEEVRDVSTQELRRIASAKEERGSGPTNAKKRKSTSRGASDAGEEDEVEDYNEHHGSKERYFSPRNHSEHRGRKRYRANSPDQTLLDNKPYCSLSSHSSASSTLIAHDDESLIHIKKAQLQMLNEQRPRDPKLICCDYNEADRRSRRGLPGKKEQGGAYLCLECLGAEYRDQLPPLLAEWEDEAAS